MIYLYHKRWFCFYFPRVTVVIWTCLKNSIFGTFWLVILERRQPYFVFRTKTRPKIHTFSGHRIFSDKIFGWTRKKRSKSMCRICEHFDEIQAKIFRFKIRCRRTLLRLNSTVCFAFPRLRPFLIVFRLPKKNAPQSAEKTKTPTSMWALIFSFHSFHRKNLILTSNIFRTPHFRRFSGRG